MGRQVKCLQGLEPFPTRLRPAQGVFFAYMSEMKSFCVEPPGEALVPELRAGQKGLCLSGTLKSHFADLLRRD